MLADRAVLAVAAVLATAGLLACAAARADDVPDGIWHSNGGAALTIASGNTNSENLNVNFDTKFLVEQYKWTYYGQALYGRTKANDVYSTTANLVRAGGRYDRNLTLEVYAFGGLDFERDTTRQLLLRSVASAGLGTALLKTDTISWTVFGGGTYKIDHYGEAGVPINGVLRTEYNSPEVTIGEESTHKLSQTSTFTQRLAAFRDVRSGGSQRANFDSKLAVAITKRINLTVSLQDRYDGVARSPVRSNDILFMTGISAKFDSE